MYGRVGALKRCRSTADHSLVSDLSHVLRDRYPALLPGTADEDPLVAEVVEEDLSDSVVDAVIHSVIDGEGEELTDGPISTKLDDDLAAALSAALTEAPPLERRAEDPPTEEPPTYLAPTTSYRATGLFGDLHGVLRVHAEATPSEPSAELDLPPAPTSELVRLWQRSDDDILPTARRTRRRR